MKKLKKLLMSSALCLLPLAAFAEEVAAPAVISAGDTAWMIVATALVLLMTPGLAFFYGGLVRRKNVLSVLMQCFMCMCLMTVLWVVVGYSLCFGESRGGFIGSPGTHFLFKDVGIDANGTIPHILFAAFQGMFAIITPALIIGAFAERMKFSAFLVFSALWLLVCYAPLCHWAWGGGYFHGGESGNFLMAAETGAIDFAGGTVVHINAGIAALMAAIVLGKRQGYPNKISPPHNLPFAVLGAGLLWVGWFGFNAGSQLAADGVAARALMVTHVCAATAGLVWALIEWIKDGKPTVLGVISGVVAGLVAITPACGDASVSGALILGVGGAVIAYIFVTVVKPMLGYDDSLDVWGIHGMAGVWGAIAIGFLTIEGDPGAAQAWIQAKSVIATIIYTGIVSFVLLKLVDLVFGLRVEERNELVGLDRVDHAETAYTVLD